VAKVGDTICGLDSKKKVDGLGIVRGFGYVRKRCFDAVATWFCQTANATTVGDGGILDVLSREFLSNFCSMWECILNDTSRYYTGCIVVGF